MLFVIVLLASFLRLIHIDKIPPSVTGDELLYAVTAKSTYVTGHDISGTWNPLSVFLFRYPPGENQAELPYVIHLLFSGPFPFSLFLIKIPFVIQSIGIVLLLYGITKNLFGKPAGIAAGLVAAINPWLVVIGRTAYESTPATFFYLLSLYTLLLFKSWKILWCLVPLLLAFYSYIGTKLIFLPFTLIAILSAYKTNGHRFKKIYVTLFTACTIFVCIFILLLSSSSGWSRISEIMLPNSLIVSSEVDALRKSSIQTPILPILVNRYTIYIQIITEKLFRIFSPSYLFIEGDQLFLPVKMGFFYMADIIFIFLGSLYLFTINKQKFILLTLFILLGAFPHIFNKTLGDFSIHLSLMFPFIILLIGIGITHTIQGLSQKYKPIVMIIIVFIYSLGFGKFCITYFFQYPLESAGDFPIRVLSHYISLTQKIHPSVILYTTTSNDILKKYLFYSNNMTGQSIPEIRQILLQNKQIEFQNISFVSCDDTVKSIPKNNLIIYDVNCGMNITLPHIQIVRLADAGGVFNIYNDALCSKYTLNPYPTGIKISDFNVEKQSVERFCTTYFK